MMKTCSIGLKTSRWKTKETAKTNYSNTVKSFQRSPQHRRLRTWHLPKKVASWSANEDDFGFRCFSLIQKFTMHQKLFLIYTFDGPNERRWDFSLWITTNMQQRKGIEKRSWKRNIHSGTEYATFFRSRKLCADDKLFWKTEKTNSKAQNQKTTFDRLVHSAISDRLRF